jgi:hypothetical protein
MSLPLLGYSGPQCPRCDIALAPESLRSGAITCPHCRRTYEATAFQPPERKQAAVEALTIGPDGEANACANHARNVATTSCQRCGLFICSLCDMNVGSGSFCPSCFDHVRNEGKLAPAARRYRDYASMARSTAIFGVLFFYIGLGPLAIHYAIKGRKQRIADGRSTVGVTISMIVGILETLALIGMIAAIIIGAMK